MGKLLLAASQLDRLFQAWRDVRRQARRSSWPLVAAEFEALEAAPLRVLRSLGQELRAGRYEFAPKLGYTKRKSGGSRRGITVQGLRDQIVQRAMLDVIQSREPGLAAHLGKIPALLRTSTSYAGVPGRGVPEAMAAVAQAIRAGATHVALSDMKDFFPRVPRGDVVALFEAEVADPEFVQLFRRGLETELTNAAEVREWLDLFPLSEIGVAQGSLFSVLVGNLALRHFDARLNRDARTTIRYLDDFAILGRSFHEVREGFAAAEDELAKLGMTCYAPGDGSQKAALGRVSAGFDFLGCRVHPDGISPGRKAKRKLLHEIAAIIAEAKHRMRGWVATEVPRRAEPAYAQTLARIDRKICGWGDAFRFVSNRVAFAQLDREIDELLAAFHGWYAQQFRAAEAATRRRIAGISLLSDTPCPRLLQREEEQP